jgi:hypothetical protein
VEQAISVEQSSSVSISVSLKFHIFSAFFNC